MTIDTSLLARDAILLVSAMAGAALLSPVAIRIALKVGLVDRPASHKFHRKPTPYLGGLAVAVPALAAIIAILVAEPAVRVQLAAIGVGGALAAATGLADDWRTFGPRPKLALQAVAGLGLWLGGIRLAPTGVMPLDLVITVIVVLVVTNAVNLLDNMDGLTAGTLAIASLFILAAAHWQGQRLVSAMAAVIAGACLGFLPYNFHPARLFLGDAGTFFLGFLLATMLIKLELTGHSLVTRISVPLLVISVPLFDMTLVMISRWRAGRPVFRGGTDHSSHRLVALGASIPEAALLTYAVGVASGALALLLLLIGRDGVTWGVLLGGAAGASAILVWFERVHRRTMDGEVRWPRPGRTSGRLGARTDGSKVSGRLHRWADPT